MFSRKGTWRISAVLSQTKKNVCVKICLPAGDGESENHGGDRGALTSTSAVFILTRREVKWCHSHFHAATVSSARLLLPINSTLWKMDRIHLSLSLQALCPGLSLFLHLENSSTLASGAFLLYLMDYRPPQNHRLWQYVLKHVERNNRSHDEIAFL